MTMQHGAGPGAGVAQAGQGEGVAQVVRGPLPADPFARRRAALDYTGGRATG